jgi:hypothetical protein
MEILKENERKELYILSQPLILPQLQQALDSAIKKKKKNRTNFFPKKKKKSIPKSLTSQKNR